MSYVTDKSYLEYMKVTESIKALESALGELDSAIDVGETLDKEQPIVERLASSDDAELAAESIQKTIERGSSRLGIKLQTVSIEHFQDPYRRSVAVEKLSDKINDLNDKIDEIIRTIWQKIKDFFAMIVKKVKEWLNLLDKKTRQRKKILKDLPDQPSKDKVKVGQLAAIYPAVTFPADAVSQTLKSINAIMDNKDGLPDPITMGRKKKNGVIDLHFGYKITYTYVDPKIKGIDPYVLYDSEITKVVIPFTEINTPSKKDIERLMELSDRFSDFIKKIIGKEPEIKKTLDDFEKTIKDQAKQNAEKLNKGEAVDRQPLVQAREMSKAWSAYLKVYGLYVKMNVRTSKLLNDFIDNCIEAYKETKVGDSV